MPTPSELARKIVSQALTHESAIETKISVATLLIGIEAELAAENERCAKIADDAAAETADGEGEIYIARKIAKAIRNF